MNKTFTPQYIRIRNDIINRINNGELKKDQRLPAERELAEMFDVSRITVVGALRDLEEQGIIRKVRGSGSYVNCSSVTEEEPGEIFGAFFGPARITIRHGLLSSPPQTLFIVKTLAALFRMENPDIKVDVSVVNPHGWPENEDPYLGMIGAGTPPATGEFFFYSDYSCLNALQPLEVLPGYDDLISRLIPGAAVPTLDMHGQKHIHAISLYTNARHCIVNLDFLHQAGIHELPETLTFETLNDWCERLGRYARRHPGTYGITMPIPSGWHNLIGYFPYLWGDAENLDASAQSFLKILRQKSFSDGLHALAGWYQTGEPAPQQDADMFFFGKIGLSLTQTGLLWDCGTVPQRYRNFRFYPIPSAHGTKPNPSLLGGSSVGIFKGGVNSEEELLAAWKWLKFLFQKRTQYPLSFNFDMPVRLNAPSHLNDLPESFRKVIIETVQTARPQFDFKNMRPVLAVFGNEFLACLRGEISPEQCVENTQRQIQHLI